MTIGCRLCQAKFQDLQGRSGSSEESRVRRRRFS